MNSGHFDQLSAEQVSGLTTAINANDIGSLAESVLESIVGGLDSDDFSSLRKEKAGEIFQELETVLSVGCLMNTWRPR